MLPANLPSPNGIAVFYESVPDVACQQLAEQLAIPLVTQENAAEFKYLLTWRDKKLCLLDKDSLKKGGLHVSFDVRSETQKSWPAPKKGPLAQAIGRKTQTVIDATCGWGQDSFLIFRMGYQLTCVERCAVMAVLLRDGYQRLAQQGWMQQLKLTPPDLQHADAISYLSNLDTAPDCIYLDPMFPPKVKKHALAKKPMMLLRDLLGHDDDREALFQAAMQAAAKRVVVKSPDYAPPMGDGCSMSFQGKLLRYDVFLK